MAGSVLFWGTATATVAFTLGTFLRSLLAIREAYVAITFAARGAAIAQGAAATAGGGAAVAGGAGVAGAGAGTVAGTGAAGVATGGLMASMKGALGIAGAGTAATASVIGAIVAGTIGQVRAQLDVSGTIAAAARDRFGMAPDSTMGPGGHARRLAGSAANFGMFAATPASSVYGSAARWAMNTGIGRGLLGMIGREPIEAGKEREERQRQQNLTAYNSQDFESLADFRSQLMTQIYAQPEALREQQARGEQEFYDSLLGEVQGLRSDVQALAPAPD